ncbi:MAG: recombinase family protein [Eubacterium sp.]|nr:recombinase family protein [Eubacterium sp.]MCM1304458.1 recombinase family protein [Butyrivibrio sp.]MCM1343913.1 recombinase family protein [Muribaculaceae bacterium]MCM1408927.1 recombinase family protein [Lachnospiraceae bacterium]
MARVSRKAALAGTGEGCLAVFSEKVYNTAAYVRLSVEDNGRIGDKESIAMQQYMLEKYIGEQPDMRLQGVYCDNGETGTGFDRPEFERMMDQVREREIDCIVVKDLSRFGRNYVEVGYYLEKIFPYLGVRFVAVNDSYDTLKGGSGSEMVLSLKNLVNDLYAKDISNKVASSFKTKRENGEYLGTFPPYGYMKSPEDKHKLIADPEAAAVVRNIFRWREEGAGVGRIARNLNEEGIPCPTLYYHIKGYAKEEPLGAGRLWKEAIIRRILRNPVYVGHMVQGKKRRSLIKGVPNGDVPPEEWAVVEHTHMPIIDQETFSRVQEIGEERSRQGLAMEGRHGGTENIFKGLMICSECGMRMGRKKTVSTKGTVRYTFVCKIYQQNRGRQGCTKKYVREEDVQGAVLESLRLQAEMATGLEKALQQKAGTVREKEQGHEISRIQQKIRRNTALRGTLYESFCDGILTKAEYQELKAEYDQKAMELERELEGLQRESRERSDSVSSWKRWLAALKETKGAKTVTREMALGLIHSIRVSGYNELEIIWNFKDEFERMAEMIAFSRKGES